MICDYLNAEWGDHRLCPRDGRERWRIQWVAWLASAVLEAQAARRAETLRKVSDRPMEYSADFELKMIDRQTRCYHALELDGGENWSSARFGQIATAAACGISDFRFGEDLAERPSAAPQAWYQQLRAPAVQLIATGPAETPTTPDDPVRNSGLIARQGGRSGFTYAAFAPHLT